MFARCWRWENMFRFASESMANASQAKKINSLHLRPVVWRAQKGKKVPLCRDKVAGPLRGT